MFGADDQPGHSSSQTDQEETRDRNALQAQEEPIAGTSSSSSVEKQPPLAPPPAKRQEVMDTFIHKKNSVEQKKQIDKDSIYV